MPAKPIDELDANPAVDESTMLAELAKLDDEAPDEAESESPDPSADKPEDDEGVIVEDDDEAEDDDGDDEESLGDAEGAEDLDEDEDEEEADDSDEDIDVDEETQKRLAKYQELERSGKEAVAKDREKLQREQRDWLSQQERFVTRVEEAAAIERKLQSLLADPVGVLLSLGMREEDLHQVSRDAFGVFKAHEGDPKFADYRRTRAKDARYSTELDELKRENASLRAEWETSKQQAEVASYLDAATHAVTDETPIVSRWLKADREEARTELRLTAKFLLDETGEIPTPEDVVKELEKIQFARLTKLGIDPEATPRPKTKTPATTGKKKTAKTLSTKSVSKTKRPTAKAPQSLDEMADDVLKAMKSGAID